jgi:hypothetical protein
MLKKPASFVLDSSKSSTYPRGYASGFNSPVALLSGLFEHPAEAFSPCSRHTVHQSATMSKVFSRNLSDRLRLSR